MNDMIHQHIDENNAKAIETLLTAKPMLIDVLPAMDAIPGMTRHTILTSGAPMDWEKYTGGQRKAIIGGLMHERLANTAEEADEIIRSGTVKVLPCQSLGCVGSLAGVTTASMPVLVVRDAESGNQAYCSLFEGKVTARLNYGVYNEQVESNLRYLENVIGPLLSEAIRTAGGIELAPIIKRALHMGDELHSRNTAASILFNQQLFPSLLALERRGMAKIDELADYILSGDYFFLRAAMACAKVTMDRIRGFSGSTIVSSMALSCREFSIQVAGLGEQWFRGPLPHLDSFGLFPGYTREDIEIMGGESVITETSGLGGFAQAAAFPLQSYQGGTPQQMIEKNLKMYLITVSEHPNFKIPFLQYRGVPFGIDIRKVVETGITPMMNIGLAGREGGQIGAGSFAAPIEPFKMALEAFEKKYK
jgi:hypothetical protein